MDPFGGAVLLVGTVVRCELFPEARKLSLKVWVDFGEAGIKKTSAEIARHYDGASLVGRQVVGLVSVPTLQIGPFVSEFLLTGFPDAEGAVVLAVPDLAVPNGSRMY